jgi:hypothetical protein
VPVRGVDGERRRSRERWFEMCAEEGAASAQRADQVCTCCLVAAYYLPRSYLLGSISSVVGWEDGWGAPRQRQFGGWMGSDAEASVGWVGRTTMKQRRL